MELSFLCNTPLFRGTTPEEVRQILTCLGAEERSYPRESIIFHCGDTPQAMGLVVSGQVRIENNDAWGSRAIIDQLDPGQVFAEAYACLPGEPMMVSVVAETDARVLFLDVARLMRTCPDACGHHARLIRNLLAIAARKNLTLSRRMLHISAKTIRARLLSYLSYQAIYQGRDRFSIPFDRQQLADYLGVDRSALSAELGKMRREGLLDFEKNRFTLHHM